MRSKKSAGAGRSISGVFIFLLIGMYALFSLLLVLIGAGVYQRVTDTAAANAQVRTSITYIASKVRAGDEAGSVTVEQIDGAPVLTFAQPDDGELYYTRIYYLADDDGPGGMLYELFSLDDGEPVDLWGGDPITEVTAFDVRVKAGGLELSVTMPGGDEQSMYLRLRSQAVI